MLQCYQRAQLTSKQEQMYHYISFLHLLSFCLQSGGCTTPLRTLVSSAQGQDDYLEDVMDPCTCKAPNKADCDLNIHNLVHLNGFMSCT
jgi:hypothetical protein